MADDDVNFVLATWLKSYRIIAHDDVVNPVVSRIPGRTYYAGQEALIKRIILKSRVLVACDAEDPGFIAGYLVFDPGRIHYIYVKGTLRLRGVARTLITHSGMDLGECIDFSHHTPDVYWIRQKFPRLNYNPYFD